MPIAVELIFDDEGNHAIKRYWDKLTQAGIPSLNTVENAIPHITIAVYNSISDRQRIEAHVEEICRTMKPFDLRFSHIGIFTVSDIPVFCAAPMSDTLITLNRKVHACCDELSLSKWPYYQLGQWIPHCTLAILEDISQASRAVQLLVDGFEPFSVRVVGMSIAEFYPITYWGEWMFGIE